ncbi:tetratricopeptide repeat protein [Rhodanobacter glycinis]|uniref:Tetratricopeptide repeat protein n=1 Tax=Rhodanobacter glycinis TaxID=582702 RepID=A0A502FBW7_9GAMM|nr:tetratricopeptide repeat protein [Rhodanobacter glycinis]TPG11407.1 tetratricopeptide repeat protein [Rhodanobacter glycinis]TPG46824.1 tetratricopeptide repeat protein [Rhodanobacter glycinis]
MNAGLIASLRKQCDGPRDGALLRFSLGNALLADGEFQAAVDELRRAVGFDPAYSAAWKLLGKACLDAGQPQAAAEAWQSGIAAAARRGDKQAEKEMTVFLRRLEKISP